MVWACWLGGAVRVVEVAAAGFSVREEQHLVLDLAEAGTGRERWRR